MQLPGYRIVQNFVGENFGRFGGFACNHQTKCITLRHTVSGIISSHQNITIQMHLQASPATKILCYTLIVMTEEFPLSHNHTF